MAILGDDRRTLNDSAMLPFRFFFGFLGCALPSVRAHRQGAFQSAEQQNPTTNLSAVYMGCKATRIQKCGIVGDLK